MGDVVKLEKGMGEKLIFLFQVWPGLTAYPDFSDNVTHEWWYENLKKFHDQVPFDGLWIVSVIFISGCLKLFLQKFKIATFPPGRASTI